MARAPAVGPLLAGAGLREHHRVLDGALEVQDWSRAEALFQQVCPTYKCAAAYLGKSVTFQMPPPAEVYTACQCKRQHQGRRAL